MTLSVASAKRRAEKASKASKTNAEGEIKAGQNIPARLRVLEIRHDGSIPENQPGSPAFSEAVK